MGQYSEVEVMAEFNIDATEIVDDLENKVREYIKSQGTEVFDFNIRDMDVNSGSVNIHIASDRYQNAEWRAEQIFEYFKAKHADTFEEFQAEIMSPENIIFWSKEDEQ
jgi:hypothetical protein